MTKHLLVLSTGQHVGKTTLSLGLVKTLQAKFQGSGKQVAYCKPVGQQHVAVGGGLRVDKDAFLFKEHFGLVQDYKDMSPVIFPDGFTRDFIDGKVTSQQLMDSIKAAHRNLYEQSDFLICEGTGHTGVGSICELNNAQVAAELKIDAVCVALGGLGSSFDQLAMNREMLEQNNVRLRGVILNKVNPVKMDMIKDYYARALKRWDIPLVGCIPDLKDLSCPTMADYAKLLKSELVSGKDASLRYFSSTRLALAPVDDSNLFKAIPNQLVITHSGRKDVIDAIIGNQEASTSHGENLKSGLILTGWNPPSAELAQRLDADNIPCIYVSPDKADSYTITARISQFTAKIRCEDVERIDLAADHVSKHCDFSFLDG
ncbi:P-loop containing nucleoside triphosphate hydrolase [Phytophthora cinnamomi]|uniref:P-loop containing nucleoside triphosphate hydrolase n=1 Tax=Phytophthora cinnamomi TaxID=4785 RepID=UPI0035595E9C|nr:P-loop containing nucleoside triphosphate hydrolase [Phytophthora cinnamomi]